MWLLLNNGQFFTLTLLAKDLCSEEASVAGWNIKMTCRITVRDIQIYMSCKLHTRTRYWWEQNKKENIKIQELSLTINKMAWQSWVPTNSPLANEFTVYYYFIKHTNKICNEYYYKVSFKLCSFCCTFK